MSNRLSPAALAVLQARIKSEARQTKASNEARLISAQSAKVQTRSARIRAERIQAPDAALTQSEASDARRANKLARKRQQADRAQVISSGFGALRNLRGLRGPNGRFLSCKGLK